VICFLCAGYSFLPLDLKQVISSVPTISIDCSIDLFYDLFARNQFYFYARKVWNSNKLIPPVEKCFGVKL